MVGWHRRHHHWRSRRAHGFGPFAGHGRFFGPGEVRLALLSLLAAGPRHGYDLMKQLEERSGGMYRASAGTVYPTLQQLEDEGLARSEEAEGKRVYRLTPAGEREVEREDASVRRIWRRAEEWGGWGDAFEPDALEITRPAFRLIKSALRASTRGRDPDRVEQVREILERARRELDSLS